MEIQGKGHGLPMAAQGEKIAMTYNFSDHVVTYEATRWRQKLQWKMGGRGEYREGKREKLKSCGM